MSGARTAPAGTFAARPHMLAAAAAGAPYLGWRGAAACLVASIMLCWPMLVTTAPLMFMDTVSYFSQGETIWSKVLEVLAKVDPGILAALAPGLFSGMGGAVAEQVAAGGIGGEAGIGGGPNVSLTVRSLAYSTFFYPASSTGLGMVLACILQTAMVLWVFLALVPPIAREGRNVALAGFAAVASLTTLPWFASYAMPDILGAILPVYYALALARLDRLGMVRQLILGALACFGILSHYGNMPLALALVAAVLLWRWWQGRLTVFAGAATIAPLAVAVVFNVAVSLYLGSLAPAGGEQAQAASALESPAAPGLSPVRLLTMRASGDGSTGAATSPEGAAADGAAGPALTLTPNRIPVLLARSVEDGPARWYLQDECRGQSPYAVCEIFDGDIPDNIDDFLWKGVNEASDDQIARVRDEETQIVWEAFKRYPGYQVAALAQNAGEQFISVGTEDLWLKPENSDHMSVADIRPDRFSGFTSAPMMTFDWITLVATVAAFVVLGYRVLTGRSSAIVMEATLVTLFALVVNAAIFGGLSAPVDRYQSRIAWLIPALLALDLAIRAGAGRAAGAEARRGDS